MSRWSWELSVETARTAKGPRAETAEERRCRTQNVPNPEGARSREFLTTSGTSRASRGGSGSVLAVTVDPRGVFRDRYGMAKLSTVLSRVATALVLLLGAALMTALASTYFGHASSPYGVCYRSSGRPVPCAVVARARAAHGS